MAVLCASGLVGCTPSTTAAPPSPSASATSSLAPTARLDDRIVLPENPRVYFFGDSWTHGYSADPGRGFTQIVGAALGWRIDAGDDGSGSGFVHTYNPNGALLPVAPRRSGTSPPTSS